MEKYYIVFRCPGCGLGLEISEGKELSFKCKECKKQNNLDKTKISPDVIKKEDFKDLPKESRVYELTLPFRPKSP